MTHLRAPSPAAIRHAIGECAALVALGIAFVVGMPIVAVVLFLLRGALAAGLAIVVFATAAVTTWHLVAPRLPLSWRQALEEYAAPTVIAIAIVACLPVVALLLFLVRGALLTSVAAVIVIGCVLSLWRHLTSHHATQHADQTK